MPPTLIGLAYLDGVRPPHLPYGGSYVDLTQAGHPLMEWEILVQGSQVIFISPPGWTGKSPAKDPPEDAPRVLIQIARTHIGLYWSGTKGDASKLDGGGWSKPKPAPPAKAEDKAKP